MKMSLKICMDLSPIAFHDKLGGEMKIFNLFVEKPTSINIIWDLILLWFRFFGEPEGLHKCYFSEFKRLEKLLPKHSTLLIANSKTIIDESRYCVDINENLLRKRDIKIAATDSKTSREDTDTVMQESLLPRVSDQQWSTSLVDLILSPAEIQMNNWKPNVLNIIQQFQDFDNEGFDVSKSYLTLCKTQRCALSFVKKFSC